MIDDRILDVLVERLVNRIEQGNTYTLEQIGKVIKQIGSLSPTNAHELGQMIKYGGNYEKIARKLAEITNLNVKDIYDIFEEVAKRDYQFAKQFYKYRNVKYIPYEENVALKTQVQALAKMTAEKYINIANTLAFTRKVNGKVIYTPLAKAYNETIDKAILSVSQGKTTFQEQMHQTVKELSESGLKTVDYGEGVSRRLDSAVRMHMQDSLRNLHNETQKIFGEEFGADGVEISVHQNPAPDHEKVQGKQFSNEEFEKFQSDQDSHSYDGTFFSKEHDGHDRRSISQYNCYHYTFSIVLGVSKPEYTNEQLKQIIENNNKGFELDGKHYTNYEGTQLQRNIEVAIRKQKDVQIMARASGDKELVEQSQKKITQLTDKYRKLNKASGLPEKKDRLRVSGYKRVKTGQPGTNLFEAENMMKYFNLNDEGILRKKENVNINDKIKDKMTNLYKDANYTKEEKELFSSSYFGNLGFKKVNDYLRKGIDEEINGIKASEIAEKLNNKIKNTKSTKDLMLYRGVNHLTQKDVDELKVGQIITDKGIMSTSMNPERAYEVSQTATFFNNTPVMYEIETRKGSNMLVSSKATDEVSLQEHEIVLPSNSNLEIIEIKKYKYVTIVKTRYI